MFVCAGHLQQVWNTQRWCVPPSKVTPPRAESCVRTRLSNRVLKRVFERPYHVSSRGCPSEGENPPPGGGAFSVVVWGRQGGARRGLARASGASSKGARTYGTWTVYAYIPWTHKCVHWMANVARCSMYRTYTIAEKYFPYDVRTSTARLLVLVLVRYS